MGYSVWREKLFSATDQRLYTQEWLDGQVANGSLSFICNEGAAFLIEFHTFPTGFSQARVFSAAGTRKAIIELGDLVIAACRELGCNRALIISRNAWVKLMKTRGFWVYQTALEKEL